MKRSHGFRLQSSVSLSLLFRCSLFLLTSHVSFLTFFFALPAFSQQTWTRTYGGTSDDAANSVHQTSDGGYIVTGATYSFGAGNGDAWLIKTNSQGDTLWTKTFGGTGEDWGRSVQQTRDGGYIIAGNTSGNVYLIKTNAVGNPLWTRTFGGAFTDVGSSVWQTSDSGFIITGWTDTSGAYYFDVYLIKTNSQGDTLWTRTYGGAGYDYGNCVQQTTDGGYIIAGRTNSFGSGGVYVIKTDSQGDTLWTRTYGGTVSAEGYSVRQTSDGGYIIAGEIDPHGGGSYDVYLIKTNASGDTLWSRTYGGTVGESGQFVQQTSDGGYIIAGGTSSFGGGGWDVYLIKTNSQGDTLWTRTYGGTETDIALCAQQSADGGYILAGETSSFGAGQYDVYLIKTDGNGNVGVDDNRGQGVKGSRGQGIKIASNPFISFASVPGHSSDRFTLYDLSGRKVGIYKGDRIGEGLSAGVYFLKPESGGAKPLRIVKLR